MKTEHIQGLTVLEKLTDLDPALVAEAEVDPAYLPPLGAGEKYERKRVRRAEREERRELNPFLRFASSGAGAACISLLVAFVLIAGIIRHAPRGTGEPTPGVTPGGAPETEAVAWSEGKIPTGLIEVNYTISTDKRVYETAPSFLKVTMRGKNPGEEIAYFQSFYIECLTNPSVVIEGFWNDLAEDRVKPLGKDEYAVWTKEVGINGATTGAMPDGIYRIHHLEHSEVPHAASEATGEYISAAFCDFAVGLEYGNTLEWAPGWDFPDIITVADQDPALLDAFFAAELSEGLVENYVTKVVREQLWHITPAGLYEATGVRVFKDAVNSFSFFLVDGTIYQLPSFGGNGFHSAVVCDYDLNGVDDILYTLSWGSGMHRSEVWVFNTETRESHQIFDTAIFRYTSSTSYRDDVLIRLVQADLCVVRMDIVPQPTFVLCHAETSQGEHGFADMRFTDLNWFARVTLTEGQLPTVSIIIENDPAENPPTTAPGFFTTADQSKTHLEKLFEADWSGTSQTETAAFEWEKFYHVTPEGMFDDYGVRLYDYADGDKSTSYLLVDGRVYDLGMCLSNAIPADIDLDGNTDILLAGTCGTEEQYSLIKTFSCKSLTLQTIYTAILGEPTERLVVRPVPYTESGTDSTLSGDYALWRADFACDEGNPRSCIYKNLRLLAQLEPNAGELPFVRIGGTEPMLSIPAVTDDGYTIEASVAQDASTGRDVLTVTFRAKWQGTAFLYPHTDVRMYVGATDERVSLSGVYAVPGRVSPTEENDGYAVITQTYTFIGTTLPEGTYRVAAGLRDGPREIDSVAFDWDGKTCRPVELPNDPSGAEDPSRETLILDPSVETVYE